MKEIPLAKVNKNNTNIRQFSDPLWRALRKERWRKQDFSKYGPFLGRPVSFDKNKIERENRDCYGSDFMENSIGYSLGNSTGVPTLLQYRTDPYVFKDSPVFSNHLVPDSSSRVDFEYDVTLLANKYLTPSEAGVAKLWLISGLTQKETADYLGISQATVCSVRNTVTKVFKEHYLYRRPSGKDNQGSIRRSTGSTHM